MKQYAVFQSPLAEKKLLLLLDYLESEWGDASRANFIKKFKTVINNLTSAPYSFPLLDADIGIRKGVVTKHTSIYYRVLNREVEIITLIDNRQNQKRLFDELKEFFAKQDL